MGVYFVRNTFCSYSTIFNIRGNNVLAFIFISSSYCCYNQYSNRKKIMKKLILMVILIAIYVVLGNYLEVNQLIVKPAHWAFYGSVFGILLMALLVV